MKIQLIKLQDKNILVSDEEVKPADGNFVFWNDMILSNKTSSFSGVPYHVCKKIIAGIPELPQIDYSLLSLEDKEKLGLLDENRIIASAQQYALDTCMNNTSCLTKVKVAFEDGMKFCDKKSEKQFTLEQLKKALSESFKASQEGYDITAEEIIQMISKKVFDVEVEMENSTASAIISGYQIKPKTTNNSIKLLKVL